MSKNMKTPEYFMQEALLEAQKALNFKEVPIGAVVVKDGIIIGRGHNTRESEELSTAHAEINAIRSASLNIGSWRLTGCEVYVTIEPCPMCAGAIFQARLKRIYYGAADYKAGACGSIFNLFEYDGLNHYCEIHPGILDGECQRLLRSFFKSKRNR